MTMLPGCKMCGFESSYEYLSQYDGMCYRCWKNLDDVRAHQYDMMIRRLERALERLEK